MVSLLVCDKDIKEINNLRQELTNDKGYRIEDVSNGNDALSRYWQINPDILVLDSNFIDLPINDLMDRLSCNPIEQKRCNTILVVSENFNAKITNVSKINRIIYKPILNNELVNTIETMSMDYNTPDLYVGEVDWLLQSLNFNCMSPGYKYMIDAISFCYYRPEKMELLNDVLEYLAFKYKVPETRVRDALKACINPFNTTDTYTCPKELLYALCNNGSGLSLKHFLQRIVSYLIKTKKQGRMF